MEGKGKCEVCVRLFFFFGSPSEQKLGENLALYNTLGLFHTTVHAARENDTTIDRLVNEMTFE